MLGGGVFYPASSALEVLRFLRKFSETIPDELVIQCDSFALPDSIRVFGDSRLLLRKPRGRREGHTTTEKIREATCRWLDRHEVCRVAKHVRPVLPAWATHLCEIELYALNDDAGPSQGSQGRVLPVTALHRSWSIGMEPPPVLPSRRRHSRIASILITLCSGRTGKVHPNQRKMFNRRPSSSSRSASSSMKSAFRDCGMRGGVGGEKAKSYCLHCSDER